MRVRQRRSRLADVKLRHLSIPVARLRDLERLALQLDVRLCELYPSLKRSDLNVGYPDLADQGHQHVVVVRDRGQQGRIFGEDVAAELAPEVEFPGRIEAQARFLEVGERGVVAIVLAEPMPPWEAAGRGLTRKLDGCFSLMSSFNYLLCNLVR